MNHRSDQLLGVIGAVRKRRNLLIVLRGGDHGRRDCGDARHHGPGRVPLPAQRRRARVIARLRGLERDRRRLLRPVRPLRRRASDAQLARLAEEKHPGVEDRFVSAIEFSGEEMRGLLARDN